jgi:hypothetical protein
MIQMEEKVVDLKFEKGLGSPTVDPNQTRTMLKLNQSIGNGLNKWPGPVKRPHEAAIKVKG